MWFAYYKLLINIYLVEKKTRISNISRKIKLVTEILSYGTGPGSDPFIDCVKFEQDFEKKIMQNFNKPIITCTVEQVSNQED